MGQVGERVKMSKKYSLFFWIKITNFLVVAILSPKIVLGSRLHAFP